MAYLFLLTFLAGIIFLVMGIFNPKLVAFITKKTLSRKQVSFIFCTVIIFSFVMVGVTAPPLEKTIKKTGTTHKVESAQATQDLGQKEATMVSEDSTNQDLNSTDSNVHGDVPGTTQHNQALPEVTSQTSNISEEQNQIKYYKVTYVVDGDTIDVDMYGKTERLRLIGINTPETKDPRKPVECFGKEASAKANELLLGQMVQLEADPSQDERDKYDRLLRYVYRKDGLSFNKWMIEQGYAYEYTYNTPYKYQSQFKTAQASAKANKLGLWADGACDAFNAQANATPPSSSDSSSIGSATSGQSDSTAPSVQCNIKGNINSDGKKLYHTPTCPSYSKTKIDESKGERWFCSESEATSAGWVRAGNC